MKKIKIFLCFFTTFIFHVYSMEKKHIVVHNIDRFLIEMNDDIAFQEVGLTGGSLYKQQGAKKTAGFLFKALNKIPIKKTVDSYPHLTCQGHKLPPIMCEWLLGANPKQLAQHAHEELTKQFSGLWNIRARNLYPAVAKMSLDPDENAHTMKPIEHISQLLSYLKAEGHPVHLIANWNHDGFKTLQKKHEKTFSVFNPSTILISGALKSFITPDNMHDLLKDKDINPKECIVLHTEEINFTQLDAIRGSHQDIEHIVKELQKRGVLTTPSK